MRPLRTPKGAMMNKSLLNKSNNNSIYKDKKYKKIYKSRKDDITTISILYLVVLIYLAIILCYSLLLKIFNFDNFPLL